MAKPIPVNRRWQENQRAAAQNGVNHVATAPAPPPVSSYQETLRETLAELFQVLQDEPEVELITPVQPPPLRVIQARYPQTCTGCGMPIRLGDSITRHPHWGEWVHVGCHERAQRTAHRTIVARFDGVCRLCNRPIQQGELITRFNHGWVHHECAQRERQ